MLRNWRLFLVVFLFFMLCKSVFFYFYHYVDEMSFSYALLICTVGTFLSIIAFPLDFIVFDSILVSKKERSYFEGDFYRKKRIDYTGKTSR